MKLEKFFLRLLVVVAVLMCIVTPLILAGLAWSQPSWSIGQYLAFGMILAVFWSIAYLMPSLAREHQVWGSESD